VFQRKDSYFLLHIHSQSKLVPYPMPLSSNNHPYLLNRAVPVAFKTIALVWQAKFTQENVLGFWGAFLVYFCFLRLDRKRRFL